MATVSFPEDIYNDFDLTKGELINPPPCGAGLIISQDPWYLEQKGRQASFEEFEKAIKNRNNDYDAMIKSYNQIRGK